MRTFFCFPLDKEVRKGIESFRSEIDSPACVKWVSRENLHITLKFLGEVKQGRLEKITERARNAMGPFGPLDFRLDKLGAFPDIDYPKVIWIGSSNTPPELIALQGSLEESLEELGFQPEDREYVPHVTVGRTKEENDGRIKRLSRNLADEDFERERTVSLDRLVLMKSELKRGGPVYEPLKKIFLC